MTCKDCKRSGKCASVNKNFSYSEDGDSWANWCDGFQTIHKSKCVKAHGLVAIQTGYNLPYTLRQIVNSSARNLQKYFTE